MLADRVLYLPSIGYCLIFSIGFQSILPKNTRLIRALYVMLLCIFVIRCNERSHDWRNNMKLFESAIRICPNNVKIYFNLAQFGALQGDYKMSLEYNLVANALKPRDIKTLINLGNAYRHLGNPQAAIRHHEEVVDIE